MRALHLCLYIILSVNLNIPQGQMELGDISKGKLEHHQDQTVLENANSPETSNSQVCGKSGVGGSGSGSAGASFVDMVDMFLDMALLALIYTDTPLHRSLNKLDVVQ